MTAKLILSMDGTVLQEYPLHRERITVGRKPHNDIVIENLAVSGEHAAVVTILNDSFLEDMDSTNGVMVNGTPVKKHFLQNNDVIEIGKYRLKYVNDARGQTSAADFEKTMVLRMPADAVAAPAASVAALRSEMPSPSSAPSADAPPAVPAAAVQILSGAGAGRQLELVKNLTTIGKAGVQVAVLTRRPHGYFITHVEGAQHPVVNGQVLDAQPHSLNNRDIIELAGIRMEFYFRD